MSANSRASASRETIYLDRVVLVAMLILNVYTWQDARGTFQACQGIPQNGTHAENLTEALTDVLEGT